MPRSIMLLVAIAACSPTREAAPPPAPRAEEPGAKRWAAIGEAAEDLYDHAKAGDWRGVDAGFARIRGGTEASIAQPMSELASDVARRDRVAVMRGANEITRIADEALDSSGPRAPAERALARLDFLGRSLEIHALENRLDALRDDARAIAETWASIRPRFATAGSERVARDFDATVAALAAARDVGEFASLAARELEQVDSLEEAARGAAPKPTTDGAK